MPKELRFDGRVAVVTGAGNGLGRCHALMLGARGAKVVVNDLGGTKDGAGANSSAADAVVAEIKAQGGQAVANYDSVEDGAKIIQTALDTYGKIDILINNAGILRDVSFQKMTQDDWDWVYRVHVLGAFRITHAAWNHMRNAGFGRIIMTASAAGIYGNFGQANYAMAKMGLIGLTNTLAIEGGRKNVLVNTIAPIAASRLTESVLPPDLLAVLKPEYVTPLVTYLSHEDCRENGGLFEIGGGFIGKLRWERAKGHSFKLSRLFTPEQVRDNWSQISSFEETTHPTDIQGAMAPIMANLGSVHSKGGNDFIDVDAALGYEFPEVEFEYTERDLALFALGVGAAQDPLNDKELQTVYELHGKGFQPLPSFAVIPAIKTMLSGKQQAPGMNYGLDRVLHGEQYTEIKRPLPSQGKLKLKARIKDIFDKGKHALVISESVAYDEKGQELIRNEITTFVRGAGGWGGERGPSGDLHVPPDRAPDAVIEEKTSANQALLYRLSGDWNPLHADPTFAKSFGFEKPILHGLCSYGFAERHVINGMCNGDHRLFKSIKVRFADSVFPGETLVTEMWKISDTNIVFRTKVKERDKVVISNAAIELYTEIPKETAAAAPSAAAEAAPVAAQPGSGDVFWGIGWYLGQHPELAEKVKLVFQFRVTDPDSNWVVDLKNGKGSVTEGTTDAPDCTLELSESDFMGMSDGSLDAQKLFFSGKLKISGNVMASQKLDFLSKIPKDEVAAAAKAAGRIPGGTASSAAPAAASAPAAAGSAASFAGMAGYVGEHPELAEKIKTVYQFRLTDPDSAWVLDLKNGKGSVTEGTTDAPDCTLELSESDFMGMSDGSLDAQKLFFSGKLKISGNVMASQKLDFLSKIPKDQGAKAVVAKPVAKAEAAPAKKSAEPKSPAVFAKVRERLAAKAGIASEIAAVIQVNVTGPNSSWVLDLKANPAKVNEGQDTAAVTTLEISERDLVALADGKANAKGLFQRGQLRVRGDVRLAKKFELLFRE
jgi:(3R)-3-hydroxyacyl-CoA dehydrogenase / 3a,7a,12a-trihydroxy-5b-cholest-24-enoyl-CoA hydratase / enoyl-CoA hydratase 2